MTQSLIVTGKTSQQHTQTWKKTLRLVSNLKQRIQKATQAGNLKKVRALKKLLQRSYSSLLLCVRPRALKKVNSSQKAFLEAKAQIRFIVRQNRDRQILVLIAKLNRFISRWSTHHQGLLTKALKSDLDHFLFVKLKKAMKRKHPKKKWTWVQNKYWASYNGDNWVFTDKETGTCLQKFKFIWGESG